MALFTLTVTSVSGFLLGYETLCWAETLKQQPSQQPTLQIEKANQAAEAGRFDEAIRVYESVRQQLPNQPTLKKNLAVLYFNRAVQLQQNKQFQASLPYFDKALALNPSDKSILQNKAGSYYLQAMDLRDQAGEAGSPVPYVTVHQLLEQALALNPGEFNLRKAQASVYLQEAVEKANQDDFLGAIPLLQQANQAEPHSRQIQESLMNVYLAVASREPELSARLPWLEKAKALLAEMQPEPGKNKPGENNLGENKWADKIARLEKPEILKPEILKAETQTSVTLPKAQTELPASAQGLSMEALLSQIENALGITPGNTSIPSRLASAEEQVLGKSQKGSLEPRVQALYIKLLGKHRTVADSNPLLRQAPVTSSANSYLADVLQQTDGRVLRWARFPIRVYLEPEPKEMPIAALFKPTYTQAVLAGLDRWKTDKSQFVTYTLVKNPLAADVEIHWVATHSDRFERDANGKSTSTQALQSLQVPHVSKASRALSLAGAFTPGIFSLAPQALVAGMQIKTAKQIQAIIDESRIELPLSPLQTLSETEALTALSNLTAHEFGHALGIKAHSTVVGDLMQDRFYAAPSLGKEALTPSVRDLETLNDIYQRPANIVLNVR
ncbi:MAG: hypothetical protein K2X01_02865 [Cyanobacteria bacterium]|nr:hypothetical protein [Cyanobacteriota bacterium]